MVRIMNGDTSFIHPVTGVRIAPFEFYDGYAHVPGEEDRQVTHGNAAQAAEQPEGDRELTPQEKAAKTRAENAAIRAQAEELGIEVKGKEIDAIKAEIAAKQAELTGGGNDDNANSSGSLQDPNANPDA